MLACKHVYKVLAEKCLQNCLIRKHSFYSVHLLLLEIFVSGILTNSWGKYGESECIFLWSKQDGGQHQGKVCPISIHILQRSVLSSLSSSKNPTRSDERKLIEQKIYHFKYRISTSLLHCKAPRWLTCLWQIFNDIGGSSTVFSKNLSSSSGRVNVHALRGYCTPGQFLDCFCFFSKTTTHW